MLFGFLSFIYIYYLLLRYEIGLITKLFILKVGTLQELIKVRDAVGRLPMVVAEDHFKKKVAAYLKENGYDDVTPVGGPCSFEHKESLYIHGEGEKTTSIKKK